MIGANTTVSIFHLSYGSSTNTYPSQADVTGVSAYIESQKLEVQAVLGQGYNVEVYLMHTEPVSLDVGDKVVDADGTEYRVSSIERHEKNTDTDDVYITMLHKERSSAH